MLWRGERRGLGQSRSGDEQAASSAVVRSASTAAELGRAQTPLLEAGAGSENRGPGTLGLGLVSALPGLVSALPADRALGSRSPVPPPMTGTAYAQASSVQAT